MLEYNKYTYEFKYMVLLFYGFLKLEFEKDYFIRYKYISLVGLLCNIVNVFLYFFRYDLYISRIIYFLVRNLSRKITAKRIVSTNSYWQTFSYSDVWVLWIFFFRFPLKCTSRMLLQFYRQLICGIKSSTSTYGVGRQIHSLNTNTPSYLLQFYILQLTVFAFLDADSISTLNPIDIKKLKK